MVLEPDDSRHLANLCGPLNDHLRLLSERLGVQIRSRGNTFELQGPTEAVADARALLQNLYAEARGGRTLTPEHIHLRLRQQGAGMTRDSSSEPLVLRTRRVHIKVRSGSQQTYVENIRRHDVNFGIGPAGTGKTYLAVAAAVEALLEDRVQRILLVRPAVEAGEKLGFLPGDLAQKVDPYLRPLYDALFETLGQEQVNRLIERNVIEIAPLAYMRGRTLNASFIILDESQNTTREQMKMFLTRIGFGSTAVITGDATQIDLPGGTQSGLLHVMEVLREVEGISFTYFGAQDIVRHPLVQSIVEAYQRYDASRNQP